MKSSVFFLFKFITDKNLYLKLSHKFVYTFQSYWKCHMQVYDTDQTKHSENLFSNKFVKSKHTQYLQPSFRLHTLNDLVYTVRNKK